MNGETDLQKLLKNLQPERNPGEYVFCQVDSYEKAAALNPLCLFQEREGVSVILPKQQADDIGLLYSSVCAWITLRVHSSLEAVGLTAAVSMVLTEEKISCNVVAAYSHDHLFIPIVDADRALRALLAFSKM
jgi:uncharacterized protein